MISYDFFLSIDPYTLVDDIKLQTPNIKTDDQLIINGCRLRKNGQTDGPFYPVYIKDGWQIINTTLVTDSQSSNVVQMNPLVIENALITNVGNYRCGATHENGSLVELNSRPIHVALRGNVKVISCNVEFS